MKTIKNFIVKAFVKWAEMDYKAHKAMYDAGLGWM